MRTVLERNVYFLKIYAAAATVVCLFLFASAFAFQASRPTSFEEINVERINIVEKDGKLRLVISNRARQHPGSVDGKLIPRPNGRPPGVLFFNHRGDEAGGLVFDENGSPTGNGVSEGTGHFVSLTFDKSRQDQVVGLQHLEGDNGEYLSGLRIWDRPQTSMSEFMPRNESVQRMPGGPAKERAERQLQQDFNAPQRLFAGRRRDKSAAVELYDSNGRSRIRISVDPTGTPKLEFMDESGRVTQSLPE
jgi:hypothetical protein